MCEQSSDMSIFMGKIAGVLIIAVVILPCTSLAQDVSWQTAQARSEAWVYGWTAIDVYSIYSNVLKADEASKSGPRASAQARVVRASLGLYGVWKNQPAFFALDSEPTLTQIHAQRDKANEFYDWRSRIPNWTVNTMLGSWVWYRSDASHGAEIFLTGLFWGEVSLLTQRMLDTDWRWQISDDTLHLSLRF